MRNRIIYAVLAFILLGCITLVVNKVNPYLRTDIFRSFAKGNWYITADKDTLYTMGYYGVRKYLVSHNEQLELLSENSTFCVDRIIARGGSFNDHYLYVTARSFLPGSVNSDQINGKLLIMKKNDLNIVKELDFDIKLIESKIYENMLIISGLGGFYIFDISKPEHLKEIFSYKHSKYREYQGFDFIKKGSELYIAFTLFGEGLEIWNITKPPQSEMICNIPIGQYMTDGKNIPGGQSMGIIAHYPYLYATLGPSSETFRTSKDRRGILVYDISDLNSVKKSVVLIPEKDWYVKNTGDKQPSYITQGKNKLFVNFAEKGVAVFSLNDPKRPKYQGTDDVSSESALIQPICSSNGKLFLGSYYWKTIYSKKIREN